MKKTRKLLILLLILLICLAISNFVLAEEEEIEIKIQRVGCVDCTNGLFKEFEKEYQQEHPNVHFKVLESDWGNFHSKISIWIRGKKEPDIYLTSIVEFPAHCDVGAYLPLDDVIDEVSGIPENLLDPFYRDGKLYAIPGSVGTYSFWYNKEIFEKAGLDPNKPPKDWNELLDYAQKIKENTDAYPLGLNLGRPEDMTQLLFSHVYFSATNTPFVDKKGKALFNSPEGIKAVQFIVDLVNKYKVTQPNPEEYTKGDLRILFANGKIAMTFDLPTSMKGLKKVTDMSSPETSKFAIADPPSSIIEGKKAMVALTSDPWVISANTKYPEIAKDILKKLLTAKWQHKHDVVYGQNPFRKDVVKEYKYDCQWVYDVVLKDLNRSFLHTPGTPPTVNSLQEKIILHNYVLKAVMGIMSVEEAMDKAAEEVNKL